MPALEPLDLDRRHTGRPGRSVSIDEALARCEYLIQQRRPLGIVTGSAGLGKTHLLRTLATSGTIHSGTVSTTPPVFLDVTASDRRAFLHALSDGLGLALWSQRPDDGLQPIFDRLQGLGECGGHQVILLDQLDRAEHSVVLALRGILAASLFARSLTVIATVRPPLPATILELSADFADVRIELQSLERNEADDLLHSSLDAGSPASRIDPDVLDELYRLTRGNPRDIERLTRLAQLAAEAEGGRTITLSNLQGALIESPPLSAATPS